MHARIKTLLSPPIFPEDEDKTRIAGLIHRILITIAISSLGYALTWLILEPDLIGRMVLILPMLPLVILLFYWNRLGQIQMTSFVLVMGIWGILLFAYTTSGGVRAAAFGGNIIVVLFAQILLGQRAAIGFAGLSIVTGAVMIYLERLGMISGPDPFTTPANMWIAQSIYFIVAIVMLNLSTLTIRDALARARQEIDDRKHAEKALREAEFRYRILAEKIPVVTYRDAPDPEGTSLYISPQIENLLGYPPEFFLNNPHFWQEILHPEDKARAMDDLARYIQENSGSVIEYRLQAKDGRWIWVRDEADVVLDEQGKTLFVQGTFSNITERKNTETALLDSEEKFNKAFNFSPIAMSISSPTTGYVDVNEAFLSLIERSREDVIGHRAREIGMWLDEDVQQKAITQLQNEGQVRDFEFRFQRKSGEIGFGLASLTMLNINREDCALSSIVDITERKRSEVDLRKSEEKFQKAFHSSPIAMGISSPTRGYLDINTSFSDITGYSREETIGHFSADIGLWKNKAFHQNALKDIEKHGFLKNIEVEFRRKTGDFGIALASAVVIEFEQEQCILVSIYDITDRLLSEKALRDSEDKFQKAFLSSPVPMLINSPTKGILNVNDAFEKLTRYERREVIGKHAFEVGLWANAEERQQTIDIVRQVGSLHEFEFQFVKKGGEVRTGSLSVDLIDIEGEKCYLASFQDITSRKEAEIALKGMNIELENRVKQRTSQLEAAVHELESFSYSISHDLRAPLRAINGFSSLLTQNYDEHLPPEAQRLQRLVQENALKMGELIDNLLKFSRMGRAPLVSSRINLAELAREVWESLAHERENRSIEFAVKDIPYCYGDIHLLRQVLMNLFGNAIKFTRTRPAAIIELGYTVFDHQEAYYVKDNGVGFEMEYADQLFGVFQRLHTDSEFEGTGVGLAIVSRIIKRHGGNIWAEGYLDQGATFYFTLPIPV